MSPRLAGTLRSRATTLPSSGYRAMSDAVSTSVLGSGADVPSSRLRMTSANGVGMSAVLIALLPRFPGLCAQGRTFVVRRSTPDIQNAISCALLRGPVFCPLALHCLFLAPRDPIGIQRLQRVFQRRCAEEIALVLVRCGDRSGHL